MHSGRSHPYYLTFVVYHPTAGGAPNVQDFMFTEVERATEWLAEQFFEGMQCIALADGRVNPGLPVQKDFVDQVVKNARSRAEFDRGNL
jgi:hypothetical protein